MAFFAKTAGVVIVAGTALVSVPTSAEAQVNAVLPIIKVVCNATALGNAITAANMTPSVLRLAPFCTYNLTAALPQITGNVALVGGPSTVIRRDPTVNIRILDVGATGTLRLRGIFILGGLLTAGNGGGVQNAGTLLISFSTVSGNAANAGSVGGIANTGRAVIANSIISTNISLAGSGGGIFNNGTMTIANSLIDGNVLNNNGAGIFTTAGHTTRIIQSTISNNLTAVGSGAGVSSAGTTTLVRTLVTLNRSAAAGGGISVAAGGSVILRQSTVRRNSPGNCAPVNSVPGCVG